MKISAGSCPRVLMLADHLGYPGGVAHGVTSYFLRVLPALHAAGVELTVCFLRNPHPAGKLLRELGIQPIFLSASKWNPFVIGKVTSAAKRCSASVLHVTGLKASLVGRAAARLVGAAVILHTHDLNGPVLTGALQRLLARPTDIGICVSESARELMARNYHVHPERTFVIHNGIRLSDMVDVPRDTRARVRSELDLDSRHTVIAMIGRMYPVKGHRAMLEMLASVVLRSPHVKLLVIGDGPERVPCEALVRRLSLEGHVCFLGQRSDIACLLAAVDLVVMPSRSEGLGLAAIEALAAGKPVVGYAVGGLKEVVRDGVNGRLVAGGDRRAFVDALVGLIENKQQRTLYGQQAICDSTQFDLEAHIERLVDCYRRAAPAYGLRDVSALGGISG